MTQQPPPSDDHRRPAETEQVLQAILESYWQALLAAINAGDQAAVNRHAARITELTGLPVAGAEIPDLPTAVHVIARSDSPGT